MASQSVATNPKTPLQQLLQQKETFPAQSGDHFAVTAAASDSQKFITQAEGNQDAIAAPAEDCPQNAQKGPQGDAGDLVGVVAALREELAAQRAENAKLRETIDNLSAVIARLAGAKQD